MDASFVPRGRPATPLPRVAAGLVLGLALGLPPALGPAVAWLVGPLLLLGATLAGVRTLLWSLLLGLLLGTAARREAARPGPAGLPLAVPGYYVLGGRVERVLSPGPRGGGFVLEVETLGEGRDRRALRGWAHVARSRPPAGAARPRLLAAEDRVRCVVWIHAARPDARTELWRYAARLPHPALLAVLPAGSPLRRALRSVRAGAADRFERYLASRDAGLARALLLGDRGRLDGRDRRAFRQVGQAHLLAVSGVHVGLLLAGVVLILRLLGLPLRATWVAGLLVAALYVPVTGAPHSAVRAGLAAACFFLGRLLGRPLTASAVLALVVVASLLARPWALHALSFQLSFAAVIGILALAPRVRALLVPWRPVIPGVLPMRRTPVRSALAVAVGAWLGTAPLVAAHFGILCPAGALVSLPALPLAALLIGFGFATLLLSPLAVFAEATAAGFALAARGLRSYLAVASDAGLRTVPVATPGAGWWLLYVLCFVAAARRGGRASLGALAGMALLLGVLVGAADPRPVRARGGGAVPREYDAPPLLMPDPLAAHVLAEPRSLALLGAGLGLFALLSVRPLRWLRPGGAAAAWVLGVAAGWRFGWPGLAAVFAPFTVATLLGRLPGADGSGPRSLTQVVANGLPALLGCALHAAGRPEAGVLFFLGALACLGADTCATEIGVRYGGAPWRLTGGRAIARGESGGVTAWGLAASLGGGLLAPGAYLLATGAPAALAAAAGAAGLAGSLLDSLLGGTLQYRGLDVATGRVVEARSVAGRQTRRHAGLFWLDNDGVNLAAGLAAGWVAVALGGLFLTYSW